MSNDRQEIKKLYCPMCGIEHELTIVTYEATIEIKGEWTKYPESYYVCERQAEGEKEFMPAKVMDQNLQNARNAYRHNHGLLTSDEIVAIRGKYGVTQLELADMLGWGGATVARYETKQIQDKAHDVILRLIRENATEAERLLEENRRRFEPSRYSEILGNIRKYDSAIYFYQKAVQALYAFLEGRKDLTGGADLNLQKICAIATFFASSATLYKVKLMKMLWYSDAISYRDYGHSITGLAYQHKPMGALPLGHDTIMFLLKYFEEWSLAGEGVSYRIMPDPEYKNYAFSPEEEKVLALVLAKFGNCTGKMLSGIMHEEEAYKRTNDNDYIPFTLARLVDT